MMLKAYELGQFETVRSLLLPSKPPSITGRHGNGRQVQIPIRKGPTLYSKWKSCSCQSSNKSAVYCTSTTENRSDAFKDRLKKRDFPSDFLFGVSSSAYQFEGAAKEGGKGPSVWDTFTHIPGNIQGDENGDGQVIRYKEDVALMKDLGINAYRFSIAWPRILPTGKLSGGVNEEGIQYYNNLINELLSNGIEPIVNLFHWDVPQALENEYGGFLSRDIIKDFRGYAELCYIEFGNRVNKWITMNEPLTFVEMGYVNGIFPPGKSENPGTDPYTVAHNLLLAHTEAASLYKNNYKAKRGEIGIALNCMHYVPYDDSEGDKAAAKRAIDFTFGRFMHPIKDGQYPKSMQDNVGERLPKFEDSEIKKLKHSIDFLGLNYYTAKYVIDASHFQKGSYSTDSCYEIRSHKDGRPIGKPTASSWLHIYPEGLNHVLLNIKENYNNPILYIIENGKEALADHKRVDALKDHLQILKGAMDSKGHANVKGYFVWSLLDNFGWVAGYTVHFGIYYVDFNDDLKRYPKKSAIWFRNFLQASRNDEGKLALLCPPPK